MHYVVYYIKLLGPNVCLFVFIKFTKLANTMFCLKSLMCYGVILVMLINLGGVGLLKLQFSSIKWGRWPDMFFVIIAVRDCSGRLQNKLSIKVAGVLDNRLGRVTFGM